MNGSQFSISPYMNGRVVAAQIIDDKHPVSVAPHPTVNTNEISYLHIWWYCIFKWPKKFVILHQHLNSSPINVLARNRNGRLTGIAEQSENNLALQKQWRSARLNFISELSPEMWTTFSCSFAAAQVCLASTCHLPQNRSEFVWSTNPAMHWPKVLRRLTQRTVGQLWSNNSYASRMHLVQDH